MSAKTKESRRKKIMEIQQGVSKRLLNRRIGDCVEVLIENITEDGLYFIGRSYMDVSGEDGVVFVKDGKGGWNGPAFMTIVGGSIGYQIGLESVGLVLVVTNQKGLRAFTGGKSFKLGADIDVAAGPVGRRASASTDTRFKAAIYSYSIAQGLFAGIGVDGSVINQNREAAKNYWGKALEAKDALARPAKDKRVADLVKALNNLQKQAK